MRNISLVTLTLAVGVGCNGQTTEGLLPLPDDKAEKHEAPRADGTCKRPRDEPESWVTSLEARDIDPRADLRLARDPCGNVVMTWIQRFFGILSTPHSSLVRLFRDGAVDWTGGTLVAPTELLAPSANPNIAMDRFGNTLMLTQSWLQVFTPAGEIHPTMPLAGLGPGGMGIAEISTGWLIEGPIMRVLSLPSGDILLERPENNHSSLDRHSFLHVGEDRVLWNQVVNGVDQYEDVFFPTNFYVFERTPEHNTSLFSSSLSDRSLYAEAALLATDGERIFMGSTYYVADPMTLERIECSESVLIDIRDENWKPDPLGFCGAIEAMALVDGSLFSLWSVPVEPLDPEYHPFEAVPILMRHDLDGRETGRFEFESIIGRTHQDGTGALDMAITDDGKAAIVGILSGGPWNGRFYLYPSTATVARVPLD